MMRTIIKRKRQAKTDYKARKGYLKSGLGRIVIRKTNKYIIAQYVESEEARDKVIVGVSSRDLLAHGWEKERKGSLKSIPAAYLTGKLLGSKIKDKGQVILDLGLQRNISGSRIYAVLKGLVEAGVDIAHDEKVFPNEDRLKGKHLKENVQKIVEGVKI